MSKNKEVFKVYRFYRNPGKEVVLQNPDMDPADLHPLYAFTNSKKMRDKFVKHRDMSQFIEISSKVDDEEYVKFANLNRGALLDKYVYSHYNMEGERDDKIVVSTWFEREYVDSYLTEGILVPIEDMIDTVFPFMFKDEIVDLLEEIGFLYMFRMAGGLERYRDVMTEEEIERIDNYDQQISFDEYNAFMKLYGDTMKKKK